MLNERHLHLDTVLAMVSICIRDSSLCDDLRSQFGVDLDRTQRRLPRITVINDRPAAIIAMGRTKDDKGIHFFVDLLGRLKRCGSQLPAEHPAGMGHNRRNDRIGQFCC